MKGEGTKENSTEKLLSYGGRIAELSIGITASQFLVFVFDYLLYPFIVYQFGLLMGGIVMTIFSLIACLLVMKVYDWSKRDWLGIESIKRLKEYTGGRKTGKILSWILRQSNPVVMLFLSIKFDPFIATIYMRHGSHQYNGMSKRDWKIFFTSLVLSNIYWTLAAFTGVTVIEYAWRHLFK